MDRPVPTDGELWLFAKSMLPPGEYIARFTLREGGTAKVFLTHKATQLEIEYNDLDVISALKNAAYFLRQNLALVEKEKRNGKSNRTQSGTGSEHDACSGGADGLHKPV